MNTKGYEINKARLNLNYREVLSYCMRICPIFQLVVRRTVGLDDTAVNGLSRLNEYQQEKLESSEWFGTILIDETATILRYRFVDDSRIILENLANDFDDWKQPRLPEDLSFLRPDGQALFVTISHENDAYFQLSANEAENLNTMMPGILRME